VILIVITSFILEVSGELKAKSASEDEEKKRVDKDQPDDEDQHDEGGAQEEEEVEDPIIEDLDKVDLSTLPVTSREVQNTEWCEFVQEEVIKYSYKAATKSGRGRDITLMEVNQLPVSVEHLDFENPHYPSILGHLLTVPHLACYGQEDQTFIDEIKKVVLAPSEGDYVFEDLDKYKNGEVGQPLEVDRLVFGGELKNGFFLEAGSWDCEKQSDTLYYEINHGWTGLLVEPIPTLYEICKSRNRKASLLRTCLSAEPKAQIVEFAMDGVKEGSMGGIVTDKRGQTMKMQCFPLYSILQAIGNPTVNFFSLDIEGSEFEVLKTVPWDKVDIQVIMVETHMLGLVFPGSRLDLIEYMATVGYRHVEGVLNGTNEIRQRAGTTDDLFVRNDVPLKGQKEDDISLKGQKEDDISVKGQKERKSEL